MVISYVLNVRANGRWRIMDKKGWENRKSKLANVYYCLMILFVLLMLLILLGIFNTDKIFFWWQV